MGRECHRGTSTQRRRDQLVELLDAVMVRPARRAPATRHHHRRRPHEARRAPGRDTGRDRRAPGPRPRLHRVPQRRADAADRSALYARRRARHGEPPVAGDRPHPVRAVTDSGPAASAPRVPALSYFFPAHNEEANLRPLVEEAMAALPWLATTWA